MVRRAPVVLALLTLACAGHSAAEPATEPPHIVESSPPASEPRAVVDVSEPVEVPLPPPELVEPLPAMLAGDGAAWVAYVQGLPEHAGAPAGVIARVYELEPDLERWRWSTFGSGADWEQSTARWDPFIAWLGRGLFDAPLSTPGVIAGRLYFLGHELYDLDATRKLIDDARVHAPGSPELVGALLLACGQRQRSHAWTEILPLADEAVGVAEVLGDPMFIRETRIWRAAGLLHRESFAAAFDILDAEIPPPSDTRPPRAYLPISGLQPIAFPEDPRDEMRFELVEIIGWSLHRERSGPYARAVGCIADAYAGTTHAKILRARHESALDVLERGPDRFESLSTAEEQARQRGCDTAADAAGARW